MGLLDGRLSDVMSEQDDAGGLQPGTGASSWELSGPPTEPAGMTLGPGDPRATDPSLGMQGTIPPTITEPTEPTDPNVALGANLWGVETLFGRRGMNRVYGPGAEHAAIAPSGAPDTTYAEPKDPDPTTTTNADPVTFDPWGNGNPFNNDDDGEGDPEFDINDPDGWGPVGADSRANGAIGKDRDGFLRNEDGQFWVPGEGWSDYRGGSVEAFTTANPDAPEGSVMLGLGQNYWNADNQLWDGTNWVDADAETFWKRDHPNSPAGTIGKTEDGQLVNALGEVWVPGQGWTGQQAVGKEMLTYVDAEGNEKPIGDPEEVGTEAWALSQLDQDLLTSADIFGDGGFGMMRPQEAKDHITRGVDIMLDQIEDMWKKGNLAESTYNNLKKRMQQQLVAWNNEWQATFGDESAYTPGFYADGTPWVPAGPSANGTGSAGGSDQDPTNGVNHGDGGR